MILREYFQGNKRSQIYDPKDATLSLILELLDYDSIMNRNIMMVLHAKQRAGYGLAQVHNI